MTKWEFLELSSEELSKAGGMNKLGSKGWEHTTTVFCPSLCQYDALEKYYFEDYFVFYFKRPLAEEETESGYEKFMRLERERAKILNKPEDIK